MSMNRRLDMIETRLNLEKELDYEVEMTIGIDGNETTYCKIGPDGQREKIDYAQAQRLMDHDDKCEIIVVD